MMDDRDKKFITILGIVLIMLLLVVFFVIPSRSESSSSTIKSVLGKGDKEESLDSYITNMREKQTIQQRHSTIMLYVNLLDSSGKDSMRKTQSPSDAPEVCELAESVAGNGSDSEKAEEISNYISDEVEYDWGNIVVDATGKPRIRSKKLPTEVLKQKKGLCGELAKTYMLMSECLDIPVYFIYGGGHAWNVIILDGEIIEVDTTSGCFDCDPLEPEHAYPVFGLCSREKCININQIAALAASQASIFDQTLAK